MSFHDLVHTSLAFPMRSMIMRV